MENYTIYKFTFLDGKTYIGQTKEKVEDRWKKGEGYKGQDVYVPIILNGWDNIKKEILHTNLTAEQADKLEKYYIKKFDSKNNGYNRTNGGGARKSYEINDPIRLEELTNNLIQLCPALIAPAPNRLLTFQELRKISKETPEKLLIKQTIYSGCYFLSAEKINKTLEVCLGGDCECYHWDFLVKWRVWETDPLTSITINTPWLEKEHVQEYTSYFILDPKVKKYYRENNNYPSIQSKGFKNYEVK